MLDIVRLLKDFWNFIMYVVEFLILVSIAWGVSIVFPLTHFQAGILLMIFWFLNLYNR